MGICRKIKRSKMTKQIKNMSEKTIERFFSAIEESPLLEKLNLFGGIYSVDEEEDVSEEETKESAADRS